MVLVEISCLECHRPVMVVKSEIKRGNGKFCSKKCSGQYKSSHIIPKPSNVECAQCAKAFYKSKSKLENSKSGLYFCSRICKDTAQKIGGIKEIMPPHYGLGNGKFSYREDAISAFGARCNRCDYDKNIAGIVVHHKDRNRENNSLDNLEVLCATCHMVEHHGEEQVA